MRNGTGPLDVAQSVNLSMFSDRRRRVAEQVNSSFPSWDLSFLELGVLEGRTGPALGAFPPGQHWRGAAAPSHSARGRSSDEALQATGSYRELQRAEREETSPRFRLVAPMLGTALSVALLVAATPLAAAAAAALVLAMVALALEARFVWAFAEGLKWRH